MKPIERLNPDHEQNIKDKVCTFCGKKITGFKDELSAKEHKITGFCQECQDKVFGI